MTTDVLIVEDEPEFLRRFSDAVLRDAGLQLVAAVASGTEGKRMLDLHGPDVLLVDLGLPDIGGVEVIRHAAERHPDCDVLVVTMFGDDAHVVESIEAGATGYLLKDASPERVAASIHELRPAARRSARALRDASSRGCGSRHARSRQRHDRRRKCRPTRRPSPGPRR